MYGAALGALGASWASALAVLAMLSTANAVALQAAVASSPGTQQKRAQLEAGENLWRAPFCKEQID